MIVDPQLGPFMQPLILPRGRALLNHMSSFERIVQNHMLLLKCQWKVDRWHGICRSLSWGASSIISGVVEAGRGVEVGLQVGYGAERTGWVSSLEGGRPEEIFGRKQRRENRVSFGESLERRFLGGSKLDIQSWGENQGPRGWLEKGRETAVWGVDCAAVRIFLEIG